MSPLDCDILFAYRIIDIVSCLYNRECYSYIVITESLDFEKSQFVLLLIGVTWSGVKGGGGSGNGRKEADDGME